MKIQKSHGADYLKRPVDRLEVLPPGLNSTAEDRAQSDQLGSLARVVRATLGLTVEEALQMSKDLGFQNN